MFQFFTNLCNEQCTNKLLQHTQTKLPYLNQLLEETFEQLETQTCIRIETVWVREHCYIVL